MFKLLLIYGENLTCFFSDLVASYRGSRSKENYIATQGNIACIEDLRDFIIVAKCMHVHLSRLLMNPVTGVY